MSFTDMSSLQLVSTGVSAGPSAGHYSGDDAVDPDTVLHALYMPRPFPSLPELTSRELRWAKNMRLKERMLGFYSENSRIGTILTSFEAGFIIVLVIESFLLTVPRIRNSQYRSAIDIFELVLQSYLLVMALTETCVLIWACTWLPQYRYPPLKGRIKFCLQKWMLFSFFCLVLNIALVFSIAIELSHHNVDSTVDGGETAKQLLQLARLLQLLRLLRVPVFARAISVLFTNIKDSLPTMMLVGTLALFAMLMSSVFFYMAEVRENPNVDSLPESLYWATITSVTVGYGDISPITAGGRAVAVITCWIGVPMFAAIIGIFSTSVALNFENYRNASNQTLREHNNAAQLVQCWWRFRALQARSKAVQAWGSKQIRNIQQGVVPQQDVQDLDNIVSVSTFSIPMDEYGKDRFVGGEDHDTLRQSHLIALMILLAVLREWTMNQTIELKNSKADVSMYNVMKEVDRLSYTVEYLTGVQQMRSKAMRGELHELSDKVDRLQATMEQILARLPSV